MISEKQLKNEKDSKSRSSTSKKTSSKESKTKSQTDTISVSPPLNPNSPRSNKLVKCT